MGSAPICRPASNWNNCRSSRAPTCLEAQAAAEKSRQEQSLANKAYVPDFNIAGGYMLMPTGNNPRNNYMVEGSVTLPWLNRRKHDAEISESTVKVTEQDAEVAAMRNAAFGQIEEALAEARAAQRLARVYHDSLEPQAEATLHAAVIAYENNQTDLLDLLDSQMAVIDVDLAWFQSMGDFAASMSDLELAVGAPIDARHNSQQQQRRRKINERPRISTSIFYGSGRLRCTRGGSRLPAPASQPSHARRTDWRPSGGAWPSGFRRARHASRSSCQRGTATRPHPDFAAALAADRRNDGRRADEELSTTSSVFPATSTSMSKASPTFKRASPDGFRVSPRTRPIST